MQKQLRIGLITISLAAALIAGSALAVSPRVQVAEITVGEHERAMLKSFQRMVRASVQQMYIQKVRGGPFLISASLVDLKTKRGDFGLQATAKVVATLRHKKSGALIGSIQGKATAVASGGSTVEAQDSALKAAVESALSNVPDVLSREH